MADVKKGRKNYESLLLLLCSISECTYIGINGYI
jgi:hypothetical protein